MRVKFHNSLNFHASLVIPNVYLTQFDPSYLNFQNLVIFASILHYHINMKQKIVVQVKMSCGKCRKKAMKIAASAEGVISVAIQGKDKDEIVVIGIRVDSAGLCTALRKKLGDANLLSVQEIKDPTPEEKKAAENKPAAADDKKVEEKKPAEKDQKKTEGGGDQKQADQKKEDKGGAAKSEAKPAPPEPTFVNYHHYPPNYYPPPNYCGAANPPQCYLYTTHYEDHPQGCIIM
ncbi:heavy metal-associated isoprenylated plant protein 41-like [Spinacia oleracea]|uniref:Heavy metal-associated isoprenylated plant protein 41-like n=1 Tax=Spinacia oleracea TaxID=3562 RepID=A0A9R0JZT0_SPIOL|nr:heavy metal-associated isoprenylated plant protein 41-like [Spinacia oleracea]